jgi:hypothetical protein
MRFRPATGIISGMTTAAATPVRRPSAVRVLTVLLVATAVTTVVVDLLNWWYAPDRGFGLAVRSGWALLRAIGFLILIRHVRRGRVGARPFGLILAVTTVFAVGRLLVPRQGVPPLPGVLGFTGLTLLCLAVIWFLYRAPGVQPYLVRHPNRLVVDRQGIFWREVAPRRPPVAAWLLTARVAAFAYSPLMLVPALVSIGRIADGDLIALPTVVVWLLAGIATSYAVLFCTWFLLRGRRWAARLLTVVTLIVVLVDLTFCWGLLGLDGLVRDGTPLLAAAALTRYALHRAARTAAGPDPATARRPGFRSWSVDSRAPVDDLPGGRV